MARNKNEKGDDSVKIVCRNKRASHDYELTDSLECGLVLQGTEVKSLRAGSASLEDAYAKIDDGELWLIGSDIPEYAEGNRFNHKPKRPRKLLLHRSEIERLVGRTHERGLTLVPTRMYFSGSRSRAKVEIALAKGKDLYDKRESMRTRDMARDVQRELREVGR